MSSFGLTALAGISSSTLDAAFTLTTSQTGETNLQFGDGVHGAALPPWSDSMPEPIYAAGGGASGHVAEATGDEVLIAFEHGQMHRSYFAAPLWSSADKSPTRDGAADCKQADLQSMSSHLNSLSEIGETESLRLQMAMDRLSKMMSTLSNLLQRIETTDAAITQNIK
jgi:hypothetical protein